MAIQVKKLVLREMGEYQQQYSRPYTPSGDSFNQNDIDSLIMSTEEGTDITASSLSGLAGRFLTPKADIRSNLDEHIVDIAGGWNERRFAFLMEAVLDSDSNSANHVLLMGYTDHSDISASEHIDPDMRMYVNSVIHINHVLGFSNSGRSRTRWRTRLANNDQVLVNPIKPSRSGTRNSYRDSEIITMRPEDIFRRRSIASISDDMDDDDVIDRRHGFTEGALKLSRRGNSIANEYLASGIRAYHSSRNRGDMFEDDYDVITTANARKSVRENLVTENELLMELTDRTNLQEEGYVVYGDLEDAFGEMIDDITTIHFANPNHLAILADSSYFDTATAEGMAGYIVSSTLPKLLMECKYSGCEVNITNDTIDGRPDIRIVSISPFSDGENIDDNLASFKDRLLVELFDDLSFRGRKIVSLRIVSQIWTETTVDIAIDGDEEERFIFPTFSDALIAPVVGTDLLQLDTLGECVVELSDYLSNKKETSSGIKIYQERDISREASRSREDRPIRTKALSI